MIQFISSPQFTIQGLTPFTSGAVVWKAAYLPFGKAQVLVETITNNIRFKGQYFDEETGLHYNINRYYNPLTGRYMTPDPIGLEGGINLYPYVLNDPINFFDPYGLKMSDIIPGFGTAIVEGAKGGAYAVGEAAKATADIAANGHPLAQTALGLAAVSVTAPLAGAAAISTLPTATSAAIYIAPYSGPIVDLTYGLFVETGPPKGWGFLSSGILTAYDAIKDFVLSQDSTTCGGR